jgi:hypothetical protein
MMKVLMEGRCEAIEPASAAVSLLYARARRMRELVAIEAMDVSLRSDAQSRIEGTIAAKV